MKENLENNKEKQINFVRSFTDYPYFLLVLNSKLVIIRTTMNDWIDISGNRMTTYYIEELLSRASSAITLVYGTQNNEEYQKMLKDVLEKYWYI